MIINRAFFQRFGLLIFIMGIVGLASSIVEEDNRWICMLLVLLGMTLNLIPDEK